MHATSWMIMEISMLSERSFIQKYRLFLICSSRIGKINPWLKKKNGSIMVDFEGMEMRLIRKVHEGIF